jgi:hypothetical protein
MLNTAAMILTAGLMMTTSITSENTILAENSSEIVCEMALGTLVSYAIQVDTSFEELDKIQTAAEKAGLGFNYKLRGIKTRLVIDMVIELGDSYELKRITVNKDEGTKYVQWMTNKDGLAIEFVDTNMEYPLTQK